MKRGHVLIITLIVLVIASIFTVALVTNLSSYTKRVGIENTRNLAHIHAQNVLQLSAAFIKPNFSGVRGVTLTWTSGDVSRDIEWWNRFKNSLFNQSDGEFWREFFERVDEQRYFSLNSNQAFNEILNSFSIDGSAVVLPITGGYVVGGNPYAVLAVSRSSVGKVEAYALAVLSIDSLNRYVYFSEKEMIETTGTRRYFVTQDLIDGPLRSEDVINIRGNPTFKSTVEASGVNVESGSPLFEMGWTSLSGSGYDMQQIKADYANDLEGLVKPMNELLNSTGEAGIKLNLAGKTIWVGNNERTANKLIVEFKSAGGGGRDHFIEVHVEYIERTRNGTETGVENLFKIHPTRDGRHQIITRGENARKWLGLDQNVPDEKYVNFNGVLVCDLPIALRNHSNSDKPMYVDGRYTIYSKESVEIYDHIVYEDFRGLLPHNRIDDIIVDATLVEQLRNATRTDFLNIVADKSVWVMETERNLKITASIYAFEGGLEVKNLNGTAGQLTIFGSLAQKVHGPIHSLDGDTIEAGYYKNYIYDYAILEGLSAIGTPAKREGILVFSIRGIY